MILLDLNQVLLSNIAMSIKNSSEIEENLIRHMVLNSIRSNYVKNKSEFGELIIACDDCNYWRKKLFPYYKASRKKNREKSLLDWNQIFFILNTIREELKIHFPYRVIQIPHAEADDIIATLVKEYSAKNATPILILSGDKDFQQLQKYTNVKQYDPTRKRWITCNSPENFLFEHIIRGDVGDGIPNILSDDDVFINSSKRQRPIRTTMVDKWINAINKSNGDIKSVFENSLVVSRWFRNSSLIDLSQIPNEIQTQVLESFSSQEKKKAKNLLGYFVEKKLKHLTESISDFY